MRRMSISRREFIKRALAGAAGALMVNVDKQVTASDERSNPAQFDLNEVSQLIRSRKVSSIELTQECLGRIGQLNAKLNAFITITAESALAEAKAADSEIQRGRR